MKYKILSHTADLRLEVYGKTMEELFKNAAEALAQILLPNYEETNKNYELKEIINIESDSINVLLVDFLNEILAKSDINKAIYKVLSLNLKNNLLEAEIFGVKVEKFDEYVKAVTHHEVDIKNEEGIFKTKLVLDI